MNSTTILRKPKLHFDTMKHPGHVTFDDSKVSRLNLPWSHFEEARWAYAEPDVIHVQIGTYVVVIHGHNLGALFASVEDHTLLRVKAQPELSLDAEREPDTFVTELRITAAPPRVPQGRKGEQLDFDLGADSATWGR